VLDDDLGLLSLLDGNGLLVLVLVLVRLALDRL
jgi:hypothetical protein